MKESYGTWIFVKRCDHVVVEKKHCWAGTICAYTDTRDGFRVERNGVEHMRDEVRSMLKRKMEGRSVENQTQTRLHSTAY